MRVQVIAKTEEVKDISKKLELDRENTILAGKMAGICYMPDDYLDKAIQDDDAAIKKAKFTASNGHHSVYEHGHITFLFTGIPKILAMILNSINVYTTSEKSARYTLMKPETETEQLKYEKWKVKMQELILATYPDMDDDILNTRLCKKFGIDKITLVKDNKLLVSDESFKLLGSEGKLQDAYEVLADLKTSETLPSYKLAMENARYMLSVFTPTVMSWTVSYRELCYVVDYFDKLKDSLENMDGEFNKRLHNVVDEFLGELAPLVDDRLVFENKKEYLRFLPVQHGITEDIGSTYFGDTYTSKYKASFAQVAQCQRHRTLRVRIIFSGDKPNEYGYYIPEIVKEAGLKKEWLKDMYEVGKYYPQGTLVQVVEQGLFEDFVLKCKERLCGRAQLEIMMMTEKLMWEFITHKDNLSEYNKKLLNSVTKDGAPCTKCNIIKCTEKCRWGSQKSLDRLI
ncbi:MAG: FAD-dependent thymidylate synthase [Lachnospiraceae bacterium]|nr:FAD-dependent thymidylate synthase [Lachnospiraceae bacterium]